jgi:eukaryotic-like serine/threonine-protein kinase
VTTAARPEPPVLGVGEVLVPGYVVVGHVNRAEALDVYEVWSEERACGCIAKVLRPDRAGEAAPRRRLLREGELLQALGHPHIVRGYETVRGPRPVVVIEMLTGETLGHMIATAPRGRLAAGDVRHLGLQLCSAIGYLHRHGVLHLDLKPSNIIATAGQARVIDLSLARPPGRVPRGIGTRQYLSPEQARGGVAGPAADVFGVGGVLFAATTGERPFGAREGDGYEQLERRAAPLGSLRRVPRALAALVDACLEPAPEARPSVAELSRGLDSLAAA